MFGQKNRLDVIKKLYKLFVMPTVMYRAEALDVIEIKCLMSECVVIRLGRAE